MASAKASVLLALLIVSAMYGSTSATWGGGGSPSTCKSCTTTANSCKRPQPKGILPWKESWKEGQWIWFTANFQESLCNSGSGVITVAPSTITMCGISIAAPGAEITIGGGPAKCTFSDGKWLTSAIPRTGNIFGVGVAYQIQAGDVSKLTGCGGFSGDATYSWTLCVTSGSSSLVGVTGQIQVAANVYNKLSSNYGAICQNPNDQSNNPGMTCDNSACSSGCDMKKGAGIPTAYACSNNLIGGGSSGIWGSGWFSQNYCGLFSNSYPVCVGPSPTPSPTPTTPCWGACPSGSTCSKPCPSDGSKCQDAQYCSTPPPATPTPTPTTPCWGACPSGSTCSKPCPSDGSKCQDAKYCSTPPPATPTPTPTTPCWGACPSGATCSKPCPTDGSKCQDAKYCSTPPPATPTPTPTPTPTTPCWGACPSGSTCGKPCPSDGSKCQDAKYCSTPPPATPTPTPTTPCWGACPSGSTCSKPCPSDGSKCQDAKYCSTPPPATPTPTPTTPCWGACPSGASCSKPCPSDGSKCQDAKYCSTPPPATPSPTPTAACWGTCPSGATCSKPCAYDGSKCQDAKYCSTPAPGGSCPVCAPCPTKCPVCP